ncbi:putative F-box protein At3g16210 [Chenopodium quinoa]|uniref:putative F-box protein At3g16210 n=1 Tax=Chenopodium quinoa TaxID=63459 RepID=UPI000B773354|nr:putative F-box protein At3g16210 [Chenopodium quinoa]
MVVRHVDTLTKVADLDDTRYLKVGYVDGVLKEQVVVPRTYEEIAHLSTDDCHLVGYVDGVLLIHTHNYRVNFGQLRILLWNPSIRKVFDVPLTKERFCATTNFGFGYDHVSDDYKVVAVDTRSNYSKSKVYRLRAGLWSSLKYNIRRRSYPTIPKLYLKNFSSTTNFEGAIYWLASDDMKRRARYSHLLCFNVSSEAFTCVKLPNLELEEGGKQPPKRCPSVVDKKLAIIDFSFTFQQVCVWVRDVYGANGHYPWTKRYSVNLRVHKFLCLRENAELLFYGKSRQVFSYDFKTQQLKNLGRHDRQIVEFMDTYKEA